MEVWCPGRLEVGEMSGTGRCLLLFPKSAFELGVSRGKHFLDILSLGGSGLFVYRALVPR